jgi:hypothetical protein
MFDSGVAGSIPAALIFALGCDFVEKEEGVLSE